MAEILLTCHSDDINNALRLKSSIQRKLVINVCLQVEDDCEIEDEDFDAMIEQTTVLLVFELGDSNISAWVTIDGVDIAHSNYEESAFPEAIDFTKNVSKGIAILDDILYTDFGLDLRPPTKCKQTQ